MAGAAFIVVKSGNFCLRVFHKAPVDYIKIGSVIVRSLIKNVPILQVIWLAPAPPTLPVIRVVLLNTGAFAERIGTWQCISIIKNIWVISSKS